MPLEAINKSAVREKSIKPYLWMQLTTWIVYSQVQENSKVFCGKLVWGYFLNQTFLKIKVCCLLWGSGILKPRTDRINILPTKDTSVVSIIKYYPNSVVTNRFNYIKASFLSYMSVFLSLSLFSAEGLQALKYDDVSKRNVLLGYSSWILFLFLFNVTDFGIIYVSHQ